MMSEMLLNDLYLLDDKSFEDKYKCEYPKFRNTSSAEEERSWNINWDLILPKPVPLHEVDTALSSVLQRYKYLEPTRTPELFDWEHAVQVYENMRRNR